jgi:hypothetical protein
MWHLVRVVRLSRVSAGLDGMEPIPTRPTGSQLTHMCTNCCVYALLHHEGGLLASPEHIEL